MLCFTNVVILFIFVSSLLNVVLELDVERHTLAYHFCNILCRRCWQWSHPSMLVYTRALCCWQCGPATTSSLPPGTWTTRSPPRLPSPRWLTSSSHEWRTTLWVVSPFVPFGVFLYLMHLHIYLFICLLICLSIHLFIYSVKCYLGAPSRGAIT